MPEAAIHQLSATALRALFLSGKISATEIVQHFLARIERIDPQVRAFLTTYPERILAQAATLDQRRSRKEPLGKMAGVPVALKDNIHLKGERTTCASKFLEHYRAPFDATVTARLLAEDAMIIGKTNMDEFAMGTTGESSAFFTTKNPWDLACVPGGSSSGSAAAVAARMVPLSLGSDTGGSIRMPAALTGVVGFKPTYGSVSRFGLVSYGSSLDQIGPFSHSASDTAMIMEAIAGHCPRDATSLPGAAPSYLEALGKPLRPGKLGVPFALLEHLALDVQNSFSKAIEEMKAIGWEVVEVDLELLRHSIEVYYILATAEAATNLARFDGIRFGRRSPHAKTLEEVYDLSRQEGFGPEVKKRLLLGTYVISSGHKDAYYVKAQKVRTLIIQALAKAFTQCDLIAMPASPLPAFPSGSVQDPLQMYLLDIYTVPANLAGLPAIALPCGFGSEKHPLGLQLMGPQNSDQFLLRAALQYEERREATSPFSNLLPPWCD